VAQDTRGKVAGGTITGLGVGAVLGAEAGWLVGIGALGIPGIGPVTAADPIAAAFAVAGATAAVGAGLGALTGWGFAQSEARDYEARIPQGDIRLVVEVAGALTDRAENILQRDGGDDIRRKLAA
jgi:hypothetical protein